MRVYTTHPPSKLYGCVQGKSLSCGVISTLRKRNPNQTRKKTGSYRRHRRMEWNIIFDTFFIGTIIIHHKKESEFFFFKIVINALIILFLMNLFSLTIWDLVKCPFLLLKSNVVALIMQCKKSFNCSYHLQVYMPKPQYK